MPRYVRSSSTGRSCPQVGLVEDDGGIDAHQFRSAQVAINNKPVSFRFNCGNDNQVVEIGRKYLNLATHVGARQFVTALRDAGDQPVGFVFDGLGIDIVAAYWFEPFALDACIDFNCRLRDEFACADCKWQ